MLDSLQRPSSVTKDFAVPFPVGSAQEQWAAHKLAPAVSHMHLQDTQAYNCALQYPPGEQTLLILKQELNNSPQSSRANQTPHSFCSSSRSAIIPATNPAPQRSN